MSREWITHSEEETIALGEALGRLAHAGDCIALSGDLGAGKTRLVRGLAKGMGVPPERVHSPTFVLVNVYRIDPGAGGSAPGRPAALVHVDAHRLTDLTDLDALGWDVLADGRNVLAIEWAERIAAHLPPDRLDARIDHEPGEARRITVTSRGEAWQTRLASLRWPS